MMGYADEGLDGAGWIITMIMIMAAISIVSIILGFYVGLSLYDCSEEQVLSGGIQEYSCQQKLSICEEDFNNVCSGCNVWKYDEK